MEIYLEALNYASESDPQFYIVVEQLCLWVIRILNYATILISGHKMVFDLRRILEQDMLSSIEHKLAEVDAQKQTIQCCTWILKPIFVTECKEDGPVRHQIV